MRYNLGERVLFVLLLIPLIILGEMLRLIHGREDDGALEDYQRIYLRSIDNKQIVARLNAKHSGRVILLVHGYLGSTINWIQSHDEFLDALPHNILALDLRNHGQSQLSLPISAGYYERYDVQVALKYCRMRWNEVILVGTSMGVYSSLYGITDLEEIYLPDKIVFESFGTDVKEGVAKFFTKYARFPPRLAQFLTRYMDLRFPAMFERNLLQELKQIDRPVLIAHGKLEQLYPPADVQPLIQQHRRYETIYYTIPDSTHSKIWEQDEYLQIFEKFVTN